MVIPEPGLGVADGRAGAEFDAVIPEPGLGVTGGRAGAEFDAVIPEPGLGVADGRAGVKFDAVILLGRMVSRAAQRGGRPRWSGLKGGEGDGGTGAPIRRKMGTVRAADKDFLAERAGDTRKPTRTSGRRTNKT